MQYAEKLEQGASSLESLLFECASTAPIVVTPVLQGWALKFAATTRQRLTKEQKKNPTFISNVAQFLSCPWFVEELGFVSYCRANRQKVK